MSFRTKTSKLDRLLQYPSKVQVHHHLSSRCFSYMSNLARSDSHLGFPSHKAHSEYIDDPFLPRPHRIVSSDFDIARKNLHFARSGSKLLRQCLRIL
jgi:hypothetical protein